MVNEENKYLLFNEIKLCHPIRAYCVIDFEKTKMELSSAQKKDQNTTKTHLEVANSFGLYFKSWDDELNEYYGYDNIDDQNVIQELIDKIKFYTELLFNKLLQSVKDKFEWDESNPNTPLLKKRYEDAIECESYNIVFSDKEEDNGKFKKVIHHDHFSGELLGIVCQSCNAKMKDPFLLPILCHNLNGFDSHLFIKQLTKDKTINLKIIPLSTQKYLTFEFKMKFLNGKMTPKKKYNPETRKKENILIGVDGDRNPIYEM